jgi:four helix bundle protein
MPQSIANLRIYSQARQLEDQLFELVKSLPAEQQYPLGDDLRRASAAVCYHISEAHHRYATITKLDELGRARDAAEQVEQLLAAAKPFGATKDMTEGYVGVIKQSWGLIKYLKARQAEQEAQASIRATDELVAART